MPIPQKRRDQFYSLPEWREYLAALRAERHRDNITFIDAAAWVPDRAPDGRPGFRDVVHLAPFGSELFTRRLAQEITSARSR